MMVTRYFERSTVPIHQNLRVPTANGVETFIILSLPIICDSQTDAHFEMNPGVFNSILA
jgi:hypothetical protein